MKHFKTLLDRATSMRIDDATDQQVKTLVSVAKNLRDKYNEELERKKKDALYSKDLISCGMSY